MSIPLQERLGELRNLIDTNLQMVMKTATEIPSRLHEAISYSLLHGGKRLRPVLTLLACQQCDGVTEEAIPVACAVEMIHTYSLIHDDLPCMDDDDLRRGRPTNHKVFGEAMATLAGDALLTLAFETIAHSVVSAEVSSRCILELSQAAGWRGMVGGQVEDLQAESHRDQISNSLGPLREEFSEELALRQLKSIHSRKTGALLEASLVLGGIVASASEIQLNSLRNYGNHVGLAFQITDDLLDAVGEETKTGKRSLQDQEHGKLTYPTVLGIERSRHAAKQTITQACESLNLFESDSEVSPLRELAMFILERDH